MKIEEQKQSDWLQKAIKMKITKSIAIAIPLIDQKRMKASVAIN